MAHESSSSVPAAAAAVEMTSLTPSPEPFDQEIREDVPDEAMRKPSKARRLSMTDRRTIIHSHRRASINSALHET
ncbi:hypothetical protein TeGR_g3943 [Tetraparma gracilis]|uniref:Uncharacterized protein n=1 Tax=Tetraparma gracilis TaxID=2962635 RepID=A0ABQ6MRT3_9STRA|nr:hypothetical protein TeGR_g3943 [Tetraparma gracilis]